MSPCSTSLTPPAVQSGASKALDSKTVIFLGQSQFSANVFTVSFCSSLQTLLSLWVSGTVIHSSVLSLQAVHLQIHLALAVVSRDCEPSLNSLRVVDMRAVHASDPFQPFPRSLSDPSHPVAAKCEPRGCAGQSVRSSRINDHRLRFS